MIRRGATRVRDLVADDAGTSLMELVVGMAVMTIFMSIFTGAVVSLAETSNKVEAITSSASQANRGFLRLDKTVRYARAITTAGRGPSGDWYVELDVVVDGAESCTQLRVDTATRQLQQRTWRVSGPSSYSGLTAWQPLADSVLNGGEVAGSVDQPFATPSASEAASSSFQRVTVTLVTGTSGPANTSTTRAALTFTALNSSASDSTNDDQCRQLGPGYRP